MSIDKIRNDRSLQKKEKGGKSCLFYQLLFIKIFALVQSLVSCLRGKKHESNPRMQETDQARRCYPYLKAKYKESSERRWLLSF